jgi:hypothetical protein
LIESGCAWLGIEPKAVYGDHREELMKLLMGVAIKAGKESKRGGK